MNMNMNRFVMEEEENSWTPVKGWNTTKRDTTTTATSSIHTKT